jgi:hypothetical protein
MKELQTAVPVAPAESVAGSPVRAILVWDGPKRITLLFVGFTPPPLRVA